MKSMFIIVVLSINIMAFGSLLEVLNDGKEVKESFLEDKDVWGKWVLTEKSKKSLFRLDKKKVDKFYFYIYKSGLFVFKGFNSNGYYSTLGKYSDGLFLIYSVHKNKVVGFKGFQRARFKEGNIFFKEFDSDFKIYYRKEKKKVKRKRVITQKVNINKLKGEWELTNESKKNIDNILTPCSLPDELSKELNLTLSPSRKDKLISSYLKIYKEGSCEVRLIEQNPFLKPFFYISKGKCFIENNESNQSLVLNIKFNNLGKNRKLFFKEKNGKLILWYNYGQSEDNNALEYYKKRETIKKVKKIPFKRSDNIVVINNLEYQNQPFIKKYSWSEAVEYCSDLELNGKGWRLPTVNELKKITIKHGDKEIVKNIFQKNIFAEYNHFLFMSKTFWTIESINFFESKNIFFGFLEVKKRTNIIRYRTNTTSINNKLKLVNYQAICVRDK